MPASSVASVEAVADVEKSEDRQLQPQEAEATKEPQLEEESLDAVLFVPPPESFGNDSAQQLSSNTPGKCNSDRSLLRAR